MGAGKLNGRRPAAQRIVVTGMGAITPLGLSAEALWESLAAGRSGIGPITLCTTEGYPTKIAGEALGFDPKCYMDGKDARRMSRASQFAVAAARQAVRDAGLDEADLPEDAGVLLGTGNSSFPDIEAAMRTLVEKGGMRMSPFAMPIVLPSMSAAQVAMQLGVRGYNSTVATACAASTQAIGEAAEVLRRGDASIMLAGGTEAPISELGLAGFCVMRAMSTRNEDPAAASRPFEATRDGFVPSEGSAVVVLETLEGALARGARIYAEVLGFGSSSDAYHVTAPPPDAGGAVRSMAWALRNAGITPDDVDYINAHGTGTPHNDAGETLAIKKVFGERAYRIPVSSTKSMIGHTLTAAGAIEAVFSLLTIQTGTLPPTINYDNPDPAIELDVVPNKKRSADVSTVLSNSFGFGGQNTCLVLAREPV
jgi:3-oxoacyl-[acyl-carrier-protein] synthase II